MASLLLVLACLTWLSGSDAARSKQAVIGTAFNFDTDGFVTLPPFPSTASLTVNKVNNQCPYNKYSNAANAPMSGSFTVNGVVKKISAAHNGKQFGVIQVINGGVLLFTDDNISIKVDTIVVKGKASNGQRSALLIGDEKCRYTKKQTIEFTRNAPTNYGSYDISVSTIAGGLQVEDGALLEMHGKLYNPTWSRLAAEIKAGDTFVCIQDHVNWEAGQKIVLVTSTWQDEETKENEVREIKSVQSGNNKCKQVIELTEPTEFDHYSGGDYQVEVGLLSRSITVRGADKNHAKQYGGHIKCIGSKATPGTAQYETDMSDPSALTQCKIQGVGAYRLGQARVLGRYPFHFHIMGEAGRTSYIKDSSCWESYWRCVAIHGTNGTMIERNVAFDTYGHTYYLEDGVERDNTFLFNLGAYTHIIWETQKMEDSKAYKQAYGSVQGGLTIEQTSWLIKPSDIAACVFYISNPDNHFCGNAASGAWSTYGYPVIDYPTGAYKYLGPPSSYGGKSNPPYKLTNVNTPSPSYKNGVCKGFDGNSAHSTGYHWQSGAAVYSGGDLKYKSGTSGKLQYNTGRNGRNTQDTETYPEQIFRSGDVDGWMKWNNLKVFLTNRGCNTWGPRLDIINYESYDTGRSAVLFGESSLQHAKLVGVSRNPRLGGTISRDREVTGFKFYDVHVKTILYDILFKSFKNTGNQKVMGGTIHSDVFKPWWMSTVAKIRYADTDPAITVNVKWSDTGSSKLFNVYDMDGSMTGQTSEQPIIVGSDQLWHRASDDVDECWQKYGGAWLCKAKPGRVIVGMYIEVQGPENESQNPYFTKTSDLLLDSSTRQYSTATLNNLVRGSITQFGKPEYQIRITRNHIMSGLSGLGWYFHFHRNTGLNFPKGTPTQLELKPTVWPEGNFIIVALSYKKGTVLNGVFYQMGGDPNKFKKYYMTAESDLQKVLKGDGSNYYFGVSPTNGNQMHLMFKMAFNGQFMPFPDSYMNDEGVYVPANRGGWYSRAKYHVDVKSCPGMTKMTCPAAFDLPTATYKGIHMTDFTKSPYTTPCVERPCGQVNGKQECSVEMLRKNYQEQLFPKGNCGSDLMDADYCARTYSQGGCDKSYAKDTNCKATCNCHSPPYVCSPMFKQMRLNSTNQRQAAFWDDPSNKCLGKPIKEGANSCLLQICEDSTGQYKTVPLQAGQICDDGDAATLGDVCTGEGVNMRCEGTATVGGFQVKRRSGNRWGVVMKTIPVDASNQVKSMDVTDGLGQTITCNFVSWCQAPEQCWDCRPKAEVMGDMKVCFVSKSDNKKYCTAFIDWNYSMHQAYTVTQNSNSQWWWGFKIQPPDYIHSVKLTLTQYKDGVQQAPAVKTISCVNGGKCDSDLFGLSRKEANWGGLVEGDVKFEIKPAECIECNDEIVKARSEGREPNCDCPVMTQTLNCVGGKAYSGGKDCYEPDDGKMVCSATTLSLCGEEKQPEVACSAGSNNFPYQIQIGERADKIGDVSFPACQGSSNSRCKKAHLSGLYIYDNQMTSAGMPVYVKDKLDNNKRLYMHPLADGNANPAGELKLLFIDTPVSELSDEKINAYIDLERIGSISPAQFYSLCDKDFPTMGPSGFREGGSPKAHLKCPCGSHAMVEETFESNVTGFEENAPNAAGFPVVPVLAAVGCVLAALAFVGVLYGTRRQSSLDYELKELSEQESQ